MPFVAFWLFKTEGGGGVSEMLIGEEDNSNVTAITALPEDDVNDKLDNSLIFYFLVCSAVLWFIMNVVFFCTIDLSYLHTFFGMKTASQYSVEYFRDSSEDAQKFDCVFLSRLSFKETIFEDIRAWVLANIETWQAEKPDWFNVTLIPDEFLPAKIVTAEGGTNRRRRSSFNGLINK